MSVKKYLALDFGAESGRAIVGTLDNGRLTLEEKHRFANPMGRINGRYCWDVLGQWEQIKQGLRNTKNIQLDGIGVDTWGVDYGLLDAHGHLVGMPVMYRDARTDGMMDEAFKIVAPAELFKTTGVQFMFFNTLFQLLSQVRSQSPQLHIADKLLFMPDLFNYLLSGVARSEYSIASTSQMLNPATGQWATEIIEKMGIPARILAPIIPPGTVLGDLKADVAQECDISPTRIIAVGGHDTASAVAAVPASGDNWCYISSGTWSLMGVELDKPLINDKSFKYNYTNEGGVGGKIRFLKNIMGMWLIQECRRQFIRQGYEHSYAELTQMAARCPAFETIINPDHAPFATPGDMPGKIDAFCTSTAQHLPDTRGAYVRACIDSLAMKYRQTLEGLEELLGRRLDVIHIVGGGGQNELLNQLTADVTGRIVIAGPVEATAAGNILVQAIATGAVDDLSHARRIVRDSFNVRQYNPNPTQQTENAYRRYLDFTR
jgi:rhamnulokinase